MEGQGDHTGQVVQIECAPLGALPWPEGEKLAEDLAVHDHPGDQRHQHGETGQSDQPVPEVQPRPVQVVVHGVEPVTADFQFVIDDEFP